MVNLRTQRRLAASVLKCGKTRVWLAPESVNEIKNASTRQAVRKLVKEDSIVKKAVTQRSRWRWRRKQEQLKLGRHKGLGNRKGTKNARNPKKEAWMFRQRVLRRLLAKYRDAGKIDKHLYRELYLKSKGNVYKNKRTLLENIFKKKAELEREKRLEEQRQALAKRQTHNRLKRQERDARRKDKIRKEATRDADLVKKGSKLNKQ
mmetsp:Transcript_3367/g.4973  ORF Transcript_3367/g.4973 Transcript_3367/m.4973 type:complete len:205 (-) Transcript_3367:78-692(-)|eukprot:CAMPEP_0117430208 /NCGR_PEP_ID=MMETSP0758-20121206/9739_1 /TAXON_ID=63605 /ORGANISM="Percolomonas cosmopolitus, Strain AE-1 (ATCC 50343)" /LENGTH=204 /DNA_ID=CAMNT_0005217981 /DNA_START=37 /DNA_END=651 /DNA_ORIENTATION=-